MAYEPCQNCSSSNSISDGTFLRFDCGMPILTSGLNTTLSSSNLTLRDWSLEISKHSLSNFKLKSNEVVVLNFQHSIFFVKANGAIQIKGFLENDLNAYDFTFVDAAFINLGKKYEKIIVKNNQTNEYDVSILICLSKNL